MRDLNFKQRYGPATEPAVVEIERVIGTSLPAEYRAYLLSDGGGWAPEYLHFQVQWPASYPGAAHEPWQWLNEFFEWRDSPQTGGSVRQQWDIFRRRESEDFGLPGEVLPIAAATGGSCMILLGIADRWRDKLFFMNTNERPADPDWRYIVPVADSLQAWLQSLVDMEHVPPEYRF